MSEQEAGHSLQIFSISDGRIEHPVSDEHEGRTNQSYVASVSDIPMLVHTQGMQLLESPDLGLASPASDEEYDEKSNDVKFCIDCLTTSCSPCQKYHHAYHRKFTFENDDPTGGLPEGLSEEVKGRFNSILKYCEDYHECLIKEEESLCSQLNESLTTVDLIYDQMVERTNAKREAAKLKVRSLISAQNQKLKDKLRRNQERIEQLELIKQSGTSSVKKENFMEALKGLCPDAFLTPVSKVSVQTNISQFNLPTTEISVDVKAECKPALCICSSMKTTIKHIKTIGSMGSLALEFASPGGICIDGENCLYVADEGNNTIQKIGDKNSQKLGSFTWGQSQFCVTDVAYDPVHNQLIVPRAYTERGTLRCSAFSYVRLDGQEMNRFNVPNMQGGIRVSCSADGHIIITDHVRRSVFVVKDGRIVREIQDSQHMMKPSRAIMGFNGDILVVDSQRAQVAVFDRSGLHIRDIGKAGTRADEIRKPKGIALDTGCSIVAITDWTSDKIHLYSYHGDHIASFSDDFKCPHSVTFTDSHRMVISDCWNRQIKIYSYTTVTEQMESTHL